MQTLLSESISGLVQKIKNREVSAETLVRESLKRIENLNPKLNAFITVDGESAMEKARAIDLSVGGGRSVGRLAGIPIGIKDNICTKNLRTTAASKILDNFIPPYSATLVERLESEGAIVVGKTNLDEFAMGSSNQTSAFGPVKNPWNVERIPGGSSGGSAAAVAAQLVCAAVGTDTGGSIRSPAHFCGITGVKPTYGRVSRSGIVAYASSLDQAGPMARTPEDCALLLEVMAGHDTRDTTSSSKNVPSWVSQIHGDLKGVRLGIPREYFSEGLHESIRHTLEQTIAIAKERGAVTVEVDLPLTKFCVAAYYIIATSEASSNLARYDGVRFGRRAVARDLEEMYCKSRGEGFGAEVQRRIMIGTYALSSGYYDAYYRKACQIRRKIQVEMTVALSKCDLIFGPVSTKSAYRLGEDSGNPLEKYLDDIYTTSVNLSGLPGMSVPVGFTADGLPVGAQLIAPAFEEQRLFSVGQKLYELTPKEGRVPNVI